MPTNDEKPIESNVPCLVNVDGINRQHLHICICTRIQSHSVNESGVNQHFRRIRHHYNVMRFHLFSESDFFYLLVLLSELISLDVISLDRQRSSMGDRYKFFSVFMTFPMTHM